MNVVWPALRASEPRNTRPAFAFPSPGRRSLIRCEGVQSNNNSDVAGSLAWPHPSLLPMGEGTASPHGERVGGEGTASCRRNTRRRDMLLHGPTTRGSATPVGGTLPFRVVGLPALIPKLRLQSPDGLRSRTPFLMWFSSNLCFLPASNGRETEFQRLVGSKPTLGTRSSYTEARSRGGRERWWNSV
jgi:hypothetical protein